MSAERDSIARDRRDLHRGVLVNFVGYAIKLAQPLLLIAVVRLYGAEAFGAFAIGQASILLLTRACVLGLDKGLLWWIPRQPAGTGAQAVFPAVLLVSTLAGVVGLLLWLAATPARLMTIGVSAELSTPLRIMGLALVPAAMTDLLTHAVMGKKRMEAYVFVREGLGPASFVVIAVVFAIGGQGAEGLPLAFLASHLLTACAAWLVYLRMFGWDAKRSTHRTMPRQLLRWSLPMWLAELGNSLLLRLDTYLVAILIEDLALVGVYAVVVRVSEQLRAIRRAFDGIVLAIASEIGVGEQPDRLRAQFSHATFLVTLTQTPIFVFLLLFARWLMPLFGAEFDGATVPVVILCGFWLFNGAASMSGIVVTAYGHSHLTLFNTVLAMILELIAGVMLIPRLGLVGAALAVGIAYTVQGAVQVVQMRIITGHWNYDRTVAAPIVLAIVAAAAGGLLHAVVPTVAPQPELFARGAGFLAFGVVYGVGALWLWNARGVSRP